MKLGFDNVGYIKKQTESILERVEKYGNKLYLELGGKLFDDYHASRVLPGYEPCNKINVLKTMSDKVEIVIAINANDIISGKVRNDSGITYAREVLRLIEVFQDLGLYVGSVVITQYKTHNLVLKFKKNLEDNNINVYKHYAIEDYPMNIPLVVGEKGFGKNEYVETTRPVIVVTAPGPGSGKLAVCLSQLYHEKKKGIETGYAKFETFPIWDLPTDNSINLAYEAATADLGDVNLIDSYHLQTYGVLAVNYNRDLDAFPILDAILKEIYGENPYKSPTDMGVNKVGCSISDLEVCEIASDKEIVRRYYQALEEHSKGNNKTREIKRIEWIMQQAGVIPNSLKEAKKARDKSKKENGKPVFAISLPNGSIVTGKETELLSALSSCLLNALKDLSFIPDDKYLIRPEAIKPIQQLKGIVDSQQGLQLDGRETLIALATSACLDEEAKTALYKVAELRGSTAHSTVILTKAEKEILRELGIHTTCEPEYKPHQKLHMK